MWSVIDTYTCAIGSLIHIDILTVWQHVNEPVFLVKFAALDAFQAAITAVILATAVAGAGYKHITQGSVK